MSVGSLAWPPPFFQRRLEGLELDNYSSPRSGKTDNVVVLGRRASVLEDALGRLQNGNSSLPSA